MNKEELRAVPKIQKKKFFQVPLGTKKTTNKNAAIYPVFNINCNKKDLIFLLKEANELVSIFSASIRTIKAKNPNS